MITQLIQFHYHSIQQSAVLQHSVSVCFIENHTRILLTLVANVISVGMHNKTHPYCNAISVELTIFIWYNDHSLLRYYRKQVGISFFRKPHEIDCLAAARITPAKRFKFLNSDLNLRVFFWKVFQYFNQLVFLKFHIAICIDLIIGIWIWMPTSRNTGRCWLLGNRYLVLYA